MGKKALWDILRPFGCKVSKKIEGDPLETLTIFRKSHLAEKTEKGPVSLARYCMLRFKKTTDAGSRLYWHTVLYNSSGTGYWPRNASYVSKNLFIF